MTHNKEDQRKKDDDFIFEKVIEFHELIGPGGQDKFKGDVPAKVLDLLEEVREYNLNVRPRDENTFQNDMRLIETKESVREAVRNARREEE